MSGKLPASILFPYLAVALTLLATVFSRKAFLRKGGDFKATLLYFASFFLLLFVLPCLIVFVSAARPLHFLGQIGFSPGRAGRGLLVTAAALPLAFLAAAIGSADPRMQAFYPFSKSACARPGRFILYETAYLFLYYLPWEFVYRGVLFFVILASTDLITALAVQTIVSTLFHIGHPDTEIFAALGAGVAFGLIAFWTQSIFYPTLIHAFVGMSTDALIRRRARRSRGGS
jgi:membrane protease YdiL (CAAX protease family)